jgi:hypothetical protein
VQRYSVRPPLRKKVDLGANAQPFAQSCERLLKERAVSPLDREEKYRKCSEEFVGKREINAVEQEG